MHGLAISQGDDPQVPRSGLDFVFSRYHTPKPYAPVSLHFATDRISDDFHAPLPLDIGPLPQHLFLEIARSLHVAPASKDEKAVVGLKPPKGDSPRKASL
jgi:hypothetical protein